VADGLAGEGILGGRLQSWKAAEIWTVRVPGLGAAGGAAGLSATITTGRFSGDQVTIVNVRNPLAILTCLTTGLATATGITRLTFT
jgi:hypothetical protein